MFTTLFGQPGSVFRLTNHRKEEIRDADAVLISWQIIAYFELIMHKTAES